MNVTLAGSLLVALPELDDPNFARSVVYVIGHDAEGAVGVILNRPCELTVGSEFPLLADCASDPAVFFEGGPVADNAVLVLSDTPDGIAVAELEMLLNREPGRADSRFFVGYAGWSAGQLDGEVAAGAWLVLAGSAADVFSAEPDELWRSVLRRQGGPVARLALYPDELIAN